MAAKCFDWFMQGLCMTFGAVVLLGVLSLLISVVTQGQHSITFWR